MTDEERQDLRDFLAREVMDYPPGDTLSLGGILLKQRYDYFRPDSADAPMSQLLGVIEKMREKGFTLSLVSDVDGKAFHCAFILTPKNHWSVSKAYRSYADTLPDAVCLAARAATTGTP